MVSIDPVCSLGCGNTSIVSIFEMQIRDVRPNERVIWVKNP